MKIALIVFGIIIGVCMVLLESNARYADTAKLGEYGFYIPPNVEVFIFQIVLLGTIGAVSGWIIYKIIRLAKNIFDKYN